MSALLKNRKLAQLDKSLYPFTHHYQSINGLKYHYLDEGQGDTLLMLHGNPTWSFYYRNLIQELKPYYRCIAPDHIGCGFSEKPLADEYPYTLEQRVDDLAELVEKLNLPEPLTLIMHDWGGMIGMAFAHRYPEKVKRIVLLNTAAFHLPESKPFPWPLAFARTKPGAFLIQNFNAFSRIASHVSCTRNKLSRKLREAYCSPYQAPEDRVATLRFVQDIPLKSDDSGYKIVSEVQANLKQFANLPILICWGEKDFVFDTHFLDEWLKYFPEAEVHRFSDCGHYILEDAPEVKQIIYQFLKQHPLHD